MSAIGSRAVSCKFSFNRVFSFSFHDSRWVPNNCVSERRITPVPCDCYSADSREKRNHTKRNQLHANMHRKSQVELWRKWLPIRTHASIRSLMENQKTCSFSRQIWQGSRTDGKCVVASNELIVVWLLHIDTHSKTRATDIRVALDHYTRKTAPLKRALFIRLHAHNTHVYIGDLVYDNFYCPIIYCHQRVITAPRQMDKLMIMKHVIHAESLMRMWIYFVSLFSVFATTPRFGEMWRTIGTTSSHLRWCWKNGNIWNDPELVR